MAAHRPGTPLCGAFRQSKGNPLLIKPQLGCARRSAYNLPADDQFMYGKATLPDGLTAKLVVNNWATSTGKPSKDRLPSRDFRALNKSAISAGKLDSKSIRGYSTMYGNRLRLGGDQRPPPLPVDPNTAFGKKVQPETPIGDLISESFRHDWIVRNEQAAHVAQKSKGKKPKTTKASDGHRSVGIATAQTPALAFDEIPGPNALELWKMSKFGAVKSKVGCDGTGSEKAAGGPKQLIKRSIASPTATDSSNWSNSSIEDSSSPASPTHR